MQYLLRKDEKELESSDFNDADHEQAFEEVGSFKEVVCHEHFNWEDLGQGNVHSSKD